MPITIGKYMVKGPHTVSRNETVGDTYQLMRELQIRHLPVVDEDDQVVGVVSERDLKPALLLDHGKSILISDVMKTDLLLAKRDSSLADLVEEMAERKLGSTLVVDDNDQLIGIFTTIDALLLLESMLRNKEMQQARLDQAFFEAWPELKVRSHDFSTRF